MSRTLLRLVLKRPYYLGDDLTLDLRLVEHIHRFAAASFPANNAPASMPGTTKEIINNVLSTGSNHDVECRTLRCGIK